MPVAGGVKHLRILHVEDDLEYQEQVKERLDMYVPAVTAARHELVSTADFAAYEQDVMDGEFDLLVLDLRGANVEIEGEYAGRDLWGRVTLSGYIPVIFLTGNEQALDQVPRPSGFVEVVPKGGLWFEHLKDALSRIWDQRVIQIRFAVRDELHRLAHPHLILKSFYKDFAQSYLQATPLSPHNKDVVARLTARYVVDALEENLAKAIESALNVRIPHEKADSVDFYHVPRRLDSIAAGYILREPDESQLWVVVTPTCDLVDSGGRVPKCDRPLLIPVRDVKNLPLLVEWKEKAAALRQYEEERQGQQPNRELKDKQKHVGDLERRIWEFVELRNPSLRYYYLPPLLNLIPQGYLDFQEIGSAKLSDLKRWKTVAAISSPFAEHLQSKFSGYLGRIGVPEPVRAAMEAEMGLE